MLICPCHHQWKSCLCDPAPPPPANQSKSTLIYQTIWIITPGFTKISKGRCRVVCLCALLETGVNVVEPTIRIQESCVLFPQKIMLWQKEVTEIEVFVEETKKQLTYKSLCQFWAGHLPILYNIIFQIQDSTLEKLLCKRPHFCHNARKWPRHTEMWCWTHKLLLNYTRKLSTLLCS